MEAAAICEQNRQGLCGEPDTPKNGYASEKCLNSCVWEGDCLPLEAGGEGQMESR